MGKGTTSTAEKDADAVRTRDVLASAAVAALAFAAFSRSLQERLSGDSAWLAGAVQNAGGEDLHPFYLAAVRLFVDRFWSHDPIVGAQLFSAACAAVAAALVLLVCRMAGTPRLAGCAATVLVVASPAAWFHATTIEVHAFAFACSALGAFIAWSARRRGRTRFRLACLCGLMLAYLGHQMAILLVPGWIVLMHAREIGTTPARALARSVVAWSAAAAACVAAALALTSYLRTGVPLPDASRELGILALFGGPGNVPKMFLYGFVLPLALVLPAVAAGFWRTRREPRTLLVHAAFIAPFAAFLLFLYPVPERGGFLLLAAPFLALSSARSVGGGGAWLLPLVALQVCFGWWSVERYDSEYSATRRAEIVRRAAGGDALLIAGSYRAPAIGLQVAGAEEHSLATMADRAAAAELSPARFEELTEHTLDRFLATGRPVLVDLSYRVPDADPTFLFVDRTPLARPYYELFDDVLARHYVTERIEDPFWPLARIVGRRGDE